MADSRFPKISQTEIENLKAASSNKNTTKSATNWLNVFINWAKENGKSEEMITYEPDELNKTLEVFYAEVRKSNGCEYEPDSLKVMQAAFERYLKDNSYPLSLMKDNQFLSSRKVLEGKARQLREKGMGKRPNKAQSLTQPEEEILWQSKQLGGDSPRSLLNTMWWLLSQHFGLRGRQEHHEMKVEDFIFQRDDNGIEFITFAEGLTKTRQGGLRVKPRAVLPKMFATGMSRCPVNFMKKYLAKRPKELKNAGPFYLAVIDNPQTEIWYKNQPMGRNKIDSIMKDMVANSPLNLQTEGKRLTNHSARKTLVKKLKQSGVPKSEIKHVTGHTSEKGLDDYDSGDENQQRMISGLIDNPSTSVQPRFPFQLVSQQQHNTQVNAFGGMEASSSASPVFNFSNCQITINVSNQTPPADAQN